MQAEESTNPIAHSRSLYARIRMENMMAFCHLNESKASISASVVLIHTRSEDASDSNSASNSASMASVSSMNQALVFCRGN